MLGYQKEKSPKITYEVINAPTDLPISLQEVKDYLCIDFTDFDSLLTMLLKAAIAEAEKYTGLALIERTIKLSGDYEEPGAYMPFEPITAQDGDLQTVGYTAESLPEDLKLGVLNMVSIAFNEREKGINFDSSLKVLDKSRRRVGL